MGSLDSPVKRIADIDWRPLKTECVKGVKAMVGDGSYGSPRCVITDRPLVVFTSGGLGGKVHLTDYTGGYVKSLERLGIINAKEAKAHRDYMRARRLLSDLCDKRRSLRNLAKQLHLSLTAEQEATIERDPNAVRKDLAIAADRAESIPVRADWP